MSNYNQKKDNSKMVTSFKVNMDWADLREPYFDKGNESRGIKPKKEYRATVYCDFDKANNQEKVEFLTFLDNILSAKTDYVTGNAEHILQEAKNARIVFTKRNNPNQYCLQAVQRTDFHTMRNGQEIYCQFPVPVYNESGEKFEQPLIPDINFKEKCIAQVTVKAKPSYKTGDPVVWLELKEVQLHEFTKFYKEAKAVVTKNLDAGQVKDIDLGNLATNHADKIESAETCEEWLNAMDAELNDNIPF